MINKNELNKRIGNNIRVLRCHHGMTQSKLASTLDKTPMQVSRYEHGENSISATMLYTIAKTFNVSTEVFFKKVVD